ncbi:MAG: radical SAM protein, partial [Clostridia bacterium]|nr:radical SAM protein [Clostridia bacterium]
DILSLASYVQSLGCFVDVLDMDAEKLGVEVLKRHTNYDWVIVVFDNHIPLHKDNALNFLKQIGEFYKQKNIKTILVGKLGTYMPNVIQKIAFDCCVRGGKNIEGTLKDLLEAKTFENIKNIAYVCGDKVEIAKESSRIFDINNLPSMNRNFLNSKSYIDVKSILSSRGCCNNCSFCPVKNYWGNWQGKSAMKVVQEIEQLALLGTKKIIFLDDNATCDKNRMTEISNLLIEKKLDVKLGVLASVNTYDYETFCLMHKAGFCWVHLGIESGSNQVLGACNKNFDADKAKSIVKQLKSIGYRVRTSIIFDLEPINEENLNATIEFLTDTQPQEIRLHYVVSRLGSNFWKNNKCFGTQYIHSDNVVLTKNKNLELLEQKKFELLAKLSELGYEIITDTSAWDNEELDNPATKFISFCPSRYGLGW